MQHQVFLVFAMITSVLVATNAQNCDFSDLHVSDCQWQASRSEDASNSLQWQVFDESTVASQLHQNDAASVQQSRSPSSLLTKYALLRFGVLFNATQGKATLLSTSVSPYLRCLTFWYRANASPFSRPIVSPNPSSAQTTPWPTFRLKVLGGNQAEGDSTLLYTLPIQPGSVDGDRWQFRELSIPAVNNHYRVMVEVEIPSRIQVGYVAIDNVAFQARCDAGLHSSYTMWPGNCRGNFIIDWGEPAGCRRCSLEECAVMCDSFSNCDGFSYATGSASGGATFFDYPENYQCYLKQGSCSNPMPELPYSYFAKAGRHDSSTTSAPYAMPQATPNRYNNGNRGYGGTDDRSMEENVWAGSRTTRRQRWVPMTTWPPTTTRSQAPQRIIPQPQVPASGPYIIPAVFDDRYEQLDGNCGGNFLFRNGLRVGCQGCSLEECKQLCSKFERHDNSGDVSREHYGSRCLGFSFTGRTDVEPRCLLKSMNYCVPSYNTLGYFFYRKVLHARPHNEEDGGTVLEDQPKNGTSM